MKERLTQIQATIITWILMILMILSFFFISCTPSRNVQNDNTTMEYALDTIVDRKFVDSLCIADTLGTYPIQWTYSPMRSYETKKDISTYGWMKSSNWTFYRVIKNGNRYRVTKRSLRH